MVHVLIQMRAAALANVRSSRFGTLSLAVGGALGLLVAVSTLLVGFSSSVTVTGGADRIALVTLTWVAGRIGFAGFAGGDPALPLDLFRTLPTPRRTLARALLVVGFADPALLFMALALGSSLAFGFRHGLAAGLVGMVGVGAMLGVVSIVSTVVGAVTPTGSRRRQDAGTLLAAFLISAVAVVGTLIGPLLERLGSGDAPLLGAILRTLPTGWPAEAVMLAAQGSVAAVLPLAGLVVLGFALAAWWPHLLAERLLSSGSARRRGHTRHHRRVLPPNAFGAVTGKELRAWIRDPNRAGFLLVAITVGIGVCVVPLLSRSTTLLLPFAGLGTVVVAAAVAGNSYGFDGPSLALVLGAADAERADVRGRQLAWLILIGPYTTLLSVGGLTVGDFPDIWPWVCALLPAFLGGGAGLFPLVSLIAVQPLDDNGTPGPTWVPKIYAVLFLTMVAGIPPAGLLLTGAISENHWLSWSAIPVGIAAGIGCAEWFGRIAIARLHRAGPEIFEQLATAPSGRR